MEMKVDERELFRELAKYGLDERKMEYLEKVLKENIEPEIRKLASQLLADLCKKKLWFTNAARNYSKVAEIASTYDEKINFLMLTAEMFIRANDFFSADDFFRKALVIEKASQKEHLKIKMMTMYLTQAEYFEKINRLKNAINVYSKVLTYKPNLSQANKIRDRIAYLHERLGDLKEANRIRALKESAIQAVKEKTEKEFKTREQESISGEKFIEI